MTAVATRPPSDARATLLDVLARRADEPGALLPILHDVQDALGHIPTHARARDRRAR